MNVRTQVTEQSRPHSPGHGHPWRRAALAFLVAGGLVTAVGHHAIAQLMTWDRPIGAAADDFPTGEACASGIAISTTFGFVCSDLCTDDAQCPQDWGCKFSREGTGDFVGLCFPRQFQAP